MDDPLFQLLTINGSPRLDGHTAGLLEQFEKAASPFFSCLRLNLYEENVTPVSGELDLKLTNPSKIQRLLLESDGFVVATPTYWFNVPGVVKNFVDHLTILEEDGWLLEGKVAGCIVYSPEGGAANVAQTLSLTFNHMGITIPPYSLIFDRGQKAAWVREDIPLMAHSLYQQLQAQRTSPFTW